MRKDGKKGTWLPFTDKAVAFVLARTDPFVVLRFLFRRGAVLISVGYCDRSKTFTFFFGKCLELGKSDAFIGSVISNGLRRPKAPPVNENTSSAACIYLDRVKYSALLPQ